MANNIERYSKIIQTILEIQQREREIYNLYFNLSSIITVSELSGEHFLDADAKEAFKILDGVEIVKCNYVKGKLKFKDVIVNLYESPDNLGGTALKKCFENISIKRLLNT